MVTDEIELCNMSLANIGVKSTIADFTEKSKEAGYCNDFYHHCRQFLLINFNWHFSTKRRSLALSTEVVPADWSFAYDWPSDCLYFRRILDTNRRANHKIPWEKVIADDLQSKIILTDQEFAWGVYTADVELVTLFDAMYVEALGWLLSSKIAAPLKGTKAAEKAAKQYFSVVRAAAAADKMEIGKDQEPDTQMITGRY